MDDGYRIRQFHQETALLQGLFYPGRVGGNRIVTRARLAAVPAQGNGQLPITQCDAIVGEDSRIEICKANPLTGCPKTATRERNKDG